MVEDDSILQTQAAFKIGYEFAKNDTHDEIVRLKNEIKRLSDALLEIKWNSKEYSIRVMAHQALRIKTNE